MERKRMLPVGLENFEEIRAQGFYYVDKTGLLRDLLNNWGKVNLFTRPRRFGKSLNMSMLRTFFEIGCDKTLFEGLEISREKELCERYMGQLPVISVTFKGISGADYEPARAMMCSVIGKEALRFSFLLDSSSLSDEDKDLYRQLVRVDNGGKGIFLMSDSTLAESLHTLTDLLQKHYKRKVIILIDEYDVPLDKAYQCGYYDEMVNLIRNIFNQALKTNDSLQFAVLTGCLRVSKESIFTGLNNPRIFSVTDVRFDEYFGFTDDEVRELLTYYGLSGYYGVIKEWYDGYRFGNAGVYCPWDVICYCDELRANPGARPKAYWSHTSGNEIVRRFIGRAPKKTRSEIERLVAGEAVRRVIRQDLTYNELETSIDNLWSVLFMTGYLTQQAEPKNGAGQLLSGARGTEDEALRPVIADCDAEDVMLQPVIPDWDEEEEVLQLVIPNREIRKIFTGQIYSWFQEKAREDVSKLDDFCMAFLKADPETVERMFNEYLLKTISIRDTYVRKVKKENFYHGILLGLLSHMEEWDVSSNAESGEGYSDILVEVEEEETGIVIEVKYAEHGALEAGCAEALRQIEEKRYEQALRADGMKTVIKYGIACYRKHCRVIGGSITD